ncbi:MAG: cell division protein ZapA [Deltaproteobacteria bacterium]|nr:MAG: cell division protein ZapA [Deltaproteobacteria bacterium]
MTEKRPITVRILGKEYRIRNEAVDAAGVERAAAVVDDTMGKIRQRTGRVDSLDLAVLAALNIANRLIALREQQSEARATQVEPERVRDLIEQIETALRADVAAAH